MPRALVRARLLGFAGVLAAGACGHSGTEPGGDATLFVRADLAGTSVATVVVEVAAPDLPTSLVFNIPISNHIASGSITVPTGSSRTITMRGYDAGGVETHSGSVTLTIQPGTNPALSLVLQPLTGDVPIVATLASIIVMVTPASVTLTVGDTVRLAASVTDWNGQPAVGTVGWATSDPGVAFVDGSGLVTAIGAGTTTISATFHGAAGSATVTVHP